MKPIRIFGLTVALCASWLSYACDGNDLKFTDDQLNGSEDNGPKYGLAPGCQFEESTALSWDEKIIGEKSARELFAQYAANKQKDSIAFYPGEIQVIALTDSETAVERLHDTTGACQDLFRAPTKLVLHQEGEEISISPLVTEFNTYDFLVSSPLGETEGLRKFAIPPKLIERQKLLQVTLELLGAWDGSLDGEFVMHIESRTGSGANSSIIEHTDSWFMFTTDATR